MPNFCSRDSWPPQWDNDVCLPLSPSMVGGSIDINNEMNQRYLSKSVFLQCNWWIDQQMCDDIDNWLIWVANFVIYTNVNFVVYDDVQCCILRLAFQLMDELEFLY